VPSEGDGTTYEHYEGRQELWVDFIAGEVHVWRWATTHTLCACRCAHPQLQLQGVYAFPSCVCMLNSAFAFPFYCYADTGDGGNPTYTVARALASPQLNVKVPPALAQQISALHGPGAQLQQQESEGHQPPEWMTLPRGDVLLLGGDLAYPNPTK
jgi:hypothetical protein